jgi:hypothetical protein
MVSEHRNKKRSKSYPAKEIAKKRLVPKVLGDHLQLPFDALETLH